MSISRCTAEGSWPPWKEPFPRDHSVCDFRLLQFSVSCKVPCGFMALPRLEVVGACSTTLLKLINGRTPEPLVSLFAARLVGLLIVIFQPSGLYCHAYLELATRRVNDENLWPAVPSILGAHV